MLLQYLQMTGDLFAISSDARVSSYGVLDKFVSTAKSTVEHVLFPTHGRPSHQC